MHVGSDKFLRIRKMQLGEEKRVAQLHQKGIPTGMLSEISEDSLSALYRQISQSDSGFVYVAACQNGQVLGFIAGCTELNKIMYSFFMRNLLSLVRASTRMIFSGATLVRLRDNILYATRPSPSLPSAELLSVVVEPSVQGSGVAVNLLSSFLNEMSDKGVSKFKVMVRADFDRANAFYVKHGFYLAQQIKKGGHPANIYVRDTSLLAIRHGSA